MASNDGGPAHAQAQIILESGDGEKVITRNFHGGMSVRQFYKAHALAGALAARAEARTIMKEEDFGFLANRCGLMADAMIREDQDFSERQKVSQ